MEPAKEVLKKAVEIPEAYQAVKDFIEIHNILCGAGSTELKLREITKIVDKYVSD